MASTWPEGGSGRDQPLHGAADHPRPLTAERLAERIAGIGYHYFVDSDGDVGGSWLGRLFNFYLIGDRQQILQVRGRWNRRLSIERLAEVLALCDRWNRELVWPKCYVRVQDDGFVHVVAEVSTPFGAGATDAQVVTCIQQGLAHCAVVFDTLDRYYPDQAEAAP